MKVVIYKNTNIIIKKCTMTINAENTSVYNH